MQFALAVQPVMDFVLTVQLLFIIILVSVNVGRLSACIFHIVLGYCIMLFTYRIWCSLYVFKLGPIGL